MSYFTFAWNAAVSVVFFVHNRIVSMTVCAYACRPVYSGVQIVVVVVTHIGEKKSVK